MNLEIEAKLKVDSHEPVREALRAAGAEFVGRVLETNRIFDTRKGKLRKRGHGLRVRSSVSEKGDGETASMTFKGRRLESDLKSREEIEVGIEDAERAMRLLEALGYEQAFVFEKRRESWRLGACLVELDEVPHLGHYVEIEGAAEAAILSTQGVLGLADLKPIQKGYIALLIEYCQQNGLSTDRVFF